MKKIGVLSIILGLFMVSLCYGGEDIRITVDGKIIESDTPVQIAEGRTLVPLRAIFEAIGAEVNWDNEEKSVFATKGGTSIYIKIDEKNFKVNDDVKELDVSASIINGSTMVPARAVSESFGCDVKWDNESKTVIITTAKSDIETTTEIITDLTTEANTAATTEEITTVEYAEKYGSGIYKMGTEFPYGKYMVFAEKNKIGMVIGYDMEADATIEEVKSRAENYINGQNVIEIKENNNRGDVKRAYFCNGTDHSTMYINRANDDKLYRFSEIQLVDCYAVPYDDAEKLDLSYNGTYRVGIDIPEGSYKFLKAESCDFAFAMVDKNNIADKNMSYFIDDSGVYINLSKNTTIQIVNCDIEKDGLPYVTHKADTYKADINMDFSKISYALKNKIAQDIRAISSRTAKSKSSIESISNSWESMVKNDEDYKYFEIMSSAVDKYVVLKYDVEIWSNTYVQKNNKLVPDTKDPVYKARIEAYNDLCDSFLETFRKLESAESFNELADINHKLQDYVVYK